MTSMSVEVDLITVSKHTQKIVNLFKQMTVNPFKESWKFPRNTRKVWCETDCLGIVHTIDLLITRWLYRMYRQTMSKSFKERHPREIFFSRSLKNYRPIFFKIYVNLSHWRMIRLKQINFRWIAKHALGQKSSGWKQMFAEVVSSIDPSLYSRFVKTG